MVAGDCASGARFSPLLLRRRASPSCALDQSNRAHSRHLSSHLMVALIPESSVMCCRSPGIAACNPAHLAMLLMLFVKFVLKSTSAIYMHGVRDASSGHSPAWVGWEADRCWRQEVQRRPADLCRHVPCPLQQERSATLNSRLYPLHIHSRQGQSKPSLQAAQRPTGVLLHSEDRHGITEYYSVT